MSGFFVSEMGGIFQYILSAKHAHIFTEHKRTIKH